MLKALGSHSRSARGAVKCGKIAHWYRPAMGYPLDQTLADALYTHADIRTHTNICTHTHKQSNITFIKYTCPKKWEQARQEHEPARSLNTINRIDFAETGVVYVLCPLLCWVEFVKRALFCHERALYFRSRVDVDKVVGGLWFATIASWLQVSFHTRALQIKAGLWEERFTRIRHTEGLCQLVVHASGFLMRNIRTGRWRST